MNLMVRLPFVARFLRWRKRRMQKRQKALLIKRELRDAHYYDTRCRKNFAVLQQYGQVPPAQATIFEIGSGHSLAAAQGLALCGFRRIIATDIRRASPKSVRSALQYYHAHAAEFGIQTWPRIQGKATEKNLENFLTQNFNIDYRAPYDVAHTDLPDNSVDYVLSNVVFEHVSAELLPGIVQEAFRILVGGGVLYVTIDYKDHRAKQDANLTIYDYLQYSTAEWTKIDRKAKQNRLRESDYLAIFAAAGFELVTTKRKTITDADRAAFATIKVADEFKKYPVDELLAKHGDYVLRKPAAH